jgi:hypothetical protein
MLMKTVLTLSSAAMFAFVAFFSDAHIGSTAEAFA